MGAWYPLFIISTFSSVSTPIRRFLSGTLAAMSSTCLTYPLDVARTRFATNHTYHTLRAAFVEEYRKAGLGGFYRGFVPTIMGMIPYAGMSFFTYTTLKLHYKGFCSIFVTYFVVA